MSAVECVLKTRSILGESPVWDEAGKRLYWLDLRKPAIYRFDPATGKNTKVKAALQAYVGGIVLRAKGGMMVVDQRGIFALDLATGRMKPFAKPMKDMRAVWFNDAKCDRPR